VNKNVCWSSRKVPVILARHLRKREFSRQFFEIKTQISNLMKIRPVGKELFHADRRTDMTKLTVAFRNFANAPKYESFVLKIINLCPIKGTGQTEQADVAVSIYKSQVRNSANTPAIQDVAEVI
jgi:hypothetical protein